MRLVRITGALAALPALALLPAAAASASAPANTCSASGSRTNCANWAGQVGSAGAGDAVRYALASFKIPKVTCAAIVGPGPGSETSSWVGFGGLKSDPLEQVGVIAQCRSKKGAAIYGGFWEMFQEKYPRQTLPHLPRNTDGTGTLRAGDTITAMMTYTGKTYTFTFTDSRSSKLSWTRTARCMTSSKKHPHPAKCVNSTVEAITEMPGSTIPKMGNVDYSVQVSLTSTPDYAYGLGVLRTTKVTMNPARPSGHAGLVQASTLIGHGNLNSTFHTSWNSRAAR